jgi:hypothetical protein
MKSKIFIYKKDLLDAIDQYKVMVGEKYFIDVYNLLSELEDKEHSKENSK